MIALYGANNTIRDEGRRQEWLRAETPIFSSAAAEILRFCMIAA
jgi:hypothetical protein